MSFWNKRTAEHEDRAMNRSDRIQRAMEERIEKKDRKAVERYLKAWHKQDQGELKRWEKEFARD